MSPNFYGSINIKQAEKIGKVMESRILIVSVFCHIVQDYDVRLLLFPL